MVQKCPSLASTQSVQCFYYDVYGHKRPFGQLCHNRNFFCVKYLSYSWHVCPSIEFFTANVKEPNSAAINLKLHILSKRWKLILVSLSPFKVPLLLNLSFVWQCFAFIASCYSSHRMTQRTTKGHLRFYFDGTSFVMNLLHSQTGDTPRM